MKKLFENKIAVVTGGGSGIGFAAAKAFAGAGAQVIILGRQAGKLKAAQKKIQQLGLCEAYTVDVSKTEDVEKVFKALEKKFKHLDVLVNCAGIYGPIGAHHKNDLGLWKSALEINLFGTVNCVHSVLPVMLKQKAGKIVNLSGGGAVQPFPNFSAYAVSKAAVVRFTENLAEEYNHKNIQINAIAPGAVNTLFLDLVMKAGPENAGKEFYKKSLGQKQTGGDSPDLAAELIVWLASPENKLTGKLISAKWDPWRRLAKTKIALLNNNNRYTLRRIDNKYFYEK
jgi:NAD(P)-dependent dehydrogenase (short-subunit alcohol dehydrogenase family)